MKVNILFALILAASSAYTSQAITSPSSTITRFIINAVITQLFEMLRAVIKNGSEVNELPIMDPYQFKHFNFDLNLPRDLFGITANITEGTISGFGDFKVIKSKFDKKELSIDFDVVFPLIKFRSEYYEMEGNIQNVIPLDGAGVIYFSVIEFRFWSQILLKQSEDGKSVIVKEFQDPQFTVQGIESRVEFDKNIDSILNAILEDTLAGYLNRFNKYLATASSQPILDVLNPFLNKFHSWRIIATIIGN